MTSKLFAVRILRLFALPSKLDCTRFQNKDSFFSLYGMLRYSSTGPDTDCDCVFYK